jgi:hypothetical protein
MMDDATARGAVAYLMIGVAVVAIKMIAEGHSSVDKAARESNMGVPEFVAFSLIVVSLFWPLVAASALKRWWQ